ncbi:hypothetical protein BDN70DRAFT_925241 [Pholiota conissans]|uniref:Uncharacterized protein n=1 Tax=Pholiota conissans TaxID=109636 RepID=A0A9P5YQ03_9AGAR|nr:hypothetical protein BDN70DRAFT_925241 [Pholiota conissans]
MVPEPLFKDDKFERLFRKCIVFPAYGSRTRLADMIVRTVTVDDITSLQMHSRCIDITTTFGESARKTRVMTHQAARGRMYIFFYNMSSNLPLNLNIARMIGVTQSGLKAEKRLFWRGDVVAMLAQPESERFNFVVESLDADLSELNSLEEFFREKYFEGFLERALQLEEEQWDCYLSTYNHRPISFITGAPTSYWGSDATKKEEQFLGDINELRSFIGRLPIPRYFYMKSYTEHAANLFAAFKSVLGLQAVTGAPKFPPEIERRIFETSAFENPEFCTTLVLVARRVNAWIDPILLTTVCLLMSFDYLSSSERKLEPRDKLFLAKLKNGKAPQYYAQHVKNLSIIDPHAMNDNINNILAICTGVENLVVLSAWGVEFPDYREAGRNMRRLCISLERFAQKPPSIPNFYHHIFANITHLHLNDDSDDWPHYVGWENLSSLTHLALACSDTPDRTLRHIQTALPTVRYVALGHYECRGWDNRVVVNNSPHITARWGIRVVRLSELSVYDWERGARGQGDFWDIVEREVQRRLSTFECGVD